MARKLLNQYYFCFNDTECIVPVDIIFTILEDYNIELCKWNFAGDVSGMLQKEDGGYYLGVNSNHHINRQNFTICHELAHYFLHPKTNYFFCREKNKAHHIEVEANKFAAEFLMPSRLIMPKVRQRTPLKTMSKLFSVSPIALKFRMKNLNVWEDYKDCFGNDEFLDMCDCLAYA